MFRKIIRTTDDKVLTLLRLVLAIVVFPHGAQVDGMLARKRTRATDKTSA
jgi:hypothetical protein